ncbi:LysR family transcriptional regulator [Nitrincola iocasae]|uniref:LysR family transcriptional regulator n=1 Tax=Nitrincola iocasae TaxID=2614693 RepID=A0A5J6LF85_9GAMM|nr:LysR family transcriptional regulator [Nitrincola iocasae]QEW07279.1 LysR family transcriptional regulator [Nitrincola iocasae]
MLNLIWLKSLTTLIEQHSFQAAANQLGLAQPTVTQHIQKLEEMLCVPLIKRGRSGCQPTEYALRLLPYATSMLRLQDRALQAVQQPSMRVGASSNIGIYLLQPYLQSYLSTQTRQQDPLDLVIDTNPTIAEKLENAEIDIALMEWWPPKTGFDSQTWKTEPLVLITPPDHALTQLPSISRTMLSGLNLIGGESGSGTGRLLKTYLQDFQQMPTITMQLGSTEAVKQAVRAGLGISLVFASAVVDEVQHGSLCAIPLEDSALKKSIQIVWRHQSLGYDKRPEFVEHLLQTSINLNPAGL